MNLSQLIKGVAETSDSVRFRSSYSGRGMYGASCVGIVGSYSACQEVIAEVIIEAKNDDEDLADEFDNLVRGLLAFEQDSMGTDVILYWSHIEYEPGIDEPEEE